MELSTDLFVSSRARMRETNSASRSLISIGAPIGQSQRPHRNDLLLRESLFFFILVDNEPSWRKIAAEVFFHERRDRHSCFRLRKTAGSRVPKWRANRKRLIRSRNSLRDRNRAWKQ